MAINHIPAALSAGALVNERFRVKKVLGYGGYGNVYLVEDEIFFPGNKYALKESFSSTVSEQKQFTREAEWLKKLEHPNLPRVVEQFGWNSRQYFVMAYVEGENLEDRVDRMGALPEDQVLNWILPICDAVIYLHAQDRPIIHRDIKPGNIIVTRDERPWLVDFGIAKEVRAPRSSRKTTRAARAVSGGYSPLEQYTQGGTDVRSDVYALGATLYHLLTGICPPEAPDIVSGMARLPDADEVEPKISHQTSQAIMRAMRQKQDDRYQSVRELMEDLPSGRNFTINPNGTASQPVVVSTRGQRGAKAAKKAPAALSAAAPSPVAATAVAAPPSVIMPPAATLIGPPAAAAQQTPPASWLPPVAAPVAPPQPMQRPARGAQAKAALPQSPAALPVEKPPRRRVVVAGLVALLCGLLVLATVLLTLIYPTSHQQPFGYVQGYWDVLGRPNDLPLYLLFGLLPLAALLMVVVPVANLTGSCGRAWTHLFLILAPLVGLVPLVAWFATAQSDVLTSLISRGFVLPLVLFVGSLVIALLGLFRHWR